MLIIDNVSVIICIHIYIYIHIFYTIMGKSFRPFAPEQTPFGAFPERLLKTAVIRAHSFPKLHVGGEESALLPVEELNHGYWIPGLAEACAMESNNVETHLIPSRSQGYHDSLDFSDI